MLKLVDEKARQQQADQAQQDYEDVVYRLVIGRDPTFDEVVSVLTATGKTAVELTNDVAAQKAIRRGK
jgi:hypothetical protein